MTLLCCAKTYVTDGRYVSVQDSLSRSGSLFKPAAAEASGSLKTSGYSCSSGAWCHAAD